MKLIFSARGSAILNEWSLFFISCREMSSPMTTSFLWKKTRVRCLCGTVKNAAASWTEVSERIESWNPFSKMSPQASALKCCISILVSRKLSYALSFCFGCSVALRTWTKCRSDLRLRSCSGGSLKFTVLQECNSLLNDLSALLLLIHVVILKLNEFAY